MRICEKREKQGFLISGILKIGIQIHCFSLALTFMEVWLQGGREEISVKRTVDGYIVGQVENKVLVGSL